MDQAAAAAKQGAGKATSTLSAASSSSSASALPPAVLRHSASLGDSLAASAAAAPRQAWRDMTPVEQLLSLEGDEFAAQLTGLFTGEVYLQFVKDLSDEQVHKLSGPLNLMTYAPIAQLRQSVINVIERMAKEHPEWIQAPPPGFVATRKAAFKAAEKARAAAEQQAAESGQDEGAASGAPSDSESSVATLRRSPRDRTHSSKTASEPAASAAPPALAAALTAIASLPGPPASSKSRRSGADKSASAKSASSSRSAKPSTPPSSSESDEEDTSDESDGTSSEEEPASEPERRHKSRRGRSSRGRGKKRGAEKRRGADGFIAEEWLENTLKAGPSVKAVFAGQMADWPESRNKREIRNAVRAIDALQEGDAEGALEVLVRRVIGVHSYEKTGSWAVANLLEDHLAEQCFLSGKSFKGISEAAARIESSNKASHKPAYHKKDSQGGGSSGSGSKGAGAGGKPASGSSSK